MARSEDTSNSARATVSTAPWITLKDILLFLYLYVGRAFSWLPPPLLNLVRPVADCAFGVVSFRKRHGMVEDLAAGLGPDIPRPALQLVARRFASCAVRRTLDDLVLERGRDKPDCRSFLGREHLDEALAAGRGVLLAGLHWQAGRVARRYLTEAGYPVLSIRNARLHGVATGKLAHDMLAPRYDAFFRALHSDEVYTHDPGRSLKMLARLRRGGIVSILLDAVSTEHSMELPFLGRMRRFPAGIFYLAHVAGCPILPLFSSGGVQALEIDIGPPLPLDRTLSADEFWRTHLPKLVGILEAQVRARPEEWCWVRL